MSHRRQTQITCSRSAIKATERPFQASRVKSCSRTVVKAAFIPQGFGLVQLMLAYCCTVLQHGDASRQLRSGITINPLCSSRRSTIRAMMERLIFKLVVRRITSQFGAFSATTLARSSLELILISTGGIHQALVTSRACSLHSFPSILSIIQASASWCSSVPSRRVPLRTQVFMERWDCLFHHRIRRKRRHHVATRRTSL